MRQLDIKLAVPLLLLLLALLLLSWWQSLSPQYSLVDLEKILQTPGINAWLGYDELGRPVLQRLVVAVHNSITVVLAVVVLSALVGVPLGMAAAWFGGFWDATLVFIIDVFLAFPGLLLAIALAAILGPGIENAILALTISGWVGFARLARGQTLSIRQQPHIEAAIALGVGNCYLLWHHVLPLLRGVVLVHITFEAAGVVIAEATLSFLGLGIQPPEPSLGSMVLEGSRYMLVAPHVVLAPGITIVCMVLAIYLGGSYLNKKLPGGYKVEYSR